MSGSAGRSSDARSRVAASSSGGSPFTRRVLLGLVLGAAIRVALLPGPGSPDVGSWKLWTFVGSWDVTGIYGVGGDPPERGLIQWRQMRGTTEYPPLGLYEMAAVGRVYRAMDPDYNDSTLLTILVKLPGILFELAFVLILLTWGPRRLGARAAAWTSMAVWLNPAILVNGAGLGYLDAEMAFPAALSLLAAARGLPAVAGALLAASVLTKAQAVFIAPVVLLAVVGRHRKDLVPALGSLVAAGIVTTAVIVLPFAVRGAVPNMLQALGRLAAHDMLSGNALNVWWIVTWLARAAYAVTDLGWIEAFTMPVQILQITTLTELGWPDPKPLGSVLVMAVVAAMLWRGRRHLGLADLAFLGGWIVFAYFLLGVQVHENHLYVAVPLLALAAGLDARYRPSFWAVSALVAFNMYIFYGLGDGTPLVIDRRWTGIDITVLVSVVAVVLWLRGLQTLRRIHGGAGFSRPDPGRAEARPSS